MEEKVSITFTNQEKGHILHIVTQRKNYRTLCTIHNWDGVKTHLHTYSGNTRNKKVNIKMLQVKIMVIKYNMVLKNLPTNSRDFDKEHLGLSHKDVGTHYL